MMMNTPESIPEDREQSFPCPNCNEGNVTQDKNQGGMWQCDNCNWTPALTRDDI